MNISPINTLNNSAIKANYSINKTIANTTQFENKNISFNSFFNIPFLKTSPTLKPGNLKDDGLEKFYVDEIEQAKLIKKSAKSFKKLFDELYKFGAENNFEGYIPCTYNNDLKLHFRFDKKNNTQPVGFDVYDMQQKGLSRAMFSFDFNEDFSIVIASYEDDLINSEVTFTNGKISEYLEEDKSGYLKDINYFSNGCCTIEGSYYDIEDDAWNITSYLTFNPNVVDDCKILETNIDGLHFYNFDLKTGTWVLNKIIADENEALKELNNSRCNFNITL